MDDAQQMLAGLMPTARLNVPEDVAALLVEQGRSLCADSVSVYLVDHEQYLLVPLPQSEADQSPLQIDSTVAGRCLRQLELQRTASEGRETAWVPILDGLERLGVLRLGFDAGSAPAADEYLHAFAGLIAELVLTKGAYGGLFHVVRRPAADVAGGGDRLEAAPAVDVRHRPCGAGGGGGAGVRRGWRQLRLQRGRDHAALRGLRRPQQHFSGASGTAPPLAPHASRAPAQSTGDPHGR